MAKNGNFFSPSGANNEIRELANTTPASGTLASIVRDAFGVVSALKVAVTNLRSRFVYIAPPFDETALNDVVSLQGTLVKDDPTKPSSAWTYTPASGADTALTAIIAALVAPTKPVMSVEALANRLEDAIGGDALLGIASATADGAMLVTDQVNGQIRVRATNAVSLNQGNFDEDTIPAKDAIFMQSLVTAGGASFGE